MKNWLSLVGRLVGRMEVWTVYVVTVQCFVIIRVICDQLLDCIHCINNSCFVLKPGSCSTVARTECRPKTSLSSSDLRCSGPRNKLKWPTWRFPWFNEVNSSNTCFKNTNLFSADSIIIDEEVDESTDCHLVKPFAFPNFMPFRMLQRLLDRLRINWTFYFPFVWCTFAV